MVVCVFDNTLRSDVSAMKRIILTVSVAFFLNFIWEILQVSLYAPHYVGIAGLIRVHLWASLGDILLVGIAVAAGIFLEGCIFQGRQHIRRTMFFVGSAGFVLAVSVEKYALMVGRWSYNDSMPLIPWTQIGLTPVLQMIFIPIAVMMLVSKYDTRVKKVDNQ